MFFMIQLRPIGAKFKKLDQHQCIKKIKKTRMLLSYFLLWHWYLGWTLESAWLLRALKIPTKVTSPPYLITSIVLNPLVCNYPPRTQWGWATPYFTLELVQKRKKKREDRKPTIRWRDGIMPSRWIWCVLTPPFTNLSNCWEKKSFRRTY